jgi:steroid delta-isomerase
VPAPSSPSELVDRYLALHAANDLEGVLALFADGARVEDPVGGPVFEGRDAIRGFYREAHRRNGRLAIELGGPVLVCGDEVATHVRARLASPGDSPTMDVIYTLRLDDSGRIVSLRAYF